MLADPPPPGEGKARALLALFVATSVVIAAPATAQEQPYPSRPITLIVPYAAGGSIDLVARILAEGLSVRLGQPVVVEDKPGGNGVIGIGQAAKAKPDGYTLQMGAVGANVTPALVQKDYPFDPLKDYTPVAMVAEWSAILVVKAALPVDSLASSSPMPRRGRASSNFGTTGYGSFAHLVSELFMQQTGIAMQHVQYKGGAQATNDLMAGTIDAQMMSSAVGAGQAENPRLKMLAVASKRRLPSIPKVPTMAEGGVAGVDQTAWLCVFAPPGLPEAIRDRIAREVVTITPIRLPGEIPQHRLRAARHGRRGDGGDVPRRGRALECVHQGARVVRTRAIKGDTSQWWGPNSTRPLLTLPL